MRHKKRSKHLTNNNLSHNNHNLLRSDKSTYSNAYFYNNKHRCKLLSNKCFLVSTVPLGLMALALLVVVGCLVCPSVNNYSYALEVEGGGEPSVQSDDNASISLSLPDYGGASDISLQKELSSSSSAGYLSVDFNVEAANVDKYDVYVQANKNTLMGDATGSTINSITQNQNYNDLANSTEAGWGYAVAKGNQVDPTTLTYLPVQTTAVTAADSGSATNTTISQTYTLAFAANLTKALADHYRANITLSVAAGATQVATLYSVQYISNGGSNIPAPQEADSLDNSYSFTVPSDVIPKRDGYSFRGWTSNQALSLGADAEYLPGDTLSLTSVNPNTKLYAVWLKGSDFTNTLASAGSMQGMTTEICASTTTPRWWDDASLTPTVRLVDTRDNKQYWVAKLADGNCWMTQNLDLDLQEGVALTPEDSDVTENWTPGEGEGTIGENESLATTWVNDDSLVQSYDPGLYVNTRPNEQLTGCKALNSDQCKSNGWVNVSGNDADGKKYVAASDPNYGTEITTSGNDVQYNAHYTVGNYYSFSAATANSGTSLTQNMDVAADSVCPKGWRLPLSGRTAYTVLDYSDKTFARLFQSYGWVFEQGHWTDSLDGGTDYLLTKSPFYFLRGGIVSASGNSSLSYNGNYWASQTYTNEYSYRLVFESRTYAAEYPHARRYYGYSVRCVAR